jgi:gluconolactonase
MEQLGLLQTMKRTGLNEVQKASLEACEYESFSEEFDKLVESCEVLAESTQVSDVEYKFAHEAPVYVPKLGKVMFSSNRLGEGENQTIQILTVEVQTGKVELLPDSLWKEDLVMANGAVLNMMAEPKSGSERDARKVTEVLVASQGNMQKKAGVYKLDLADNSVVDVLTVSGWEGKEFNSLNDLAVDPKSGGIVFTDPAYGFAQGFRPKPSFGGVVWGYHPHNSKKKETEFGFGGEVRMLEDHFRRPNGVAFTDNGKTLLVTDSGMFPGAEFVSEYDLIGGTVPAEIGAVDFAGPRHTYAYTVVRGQKDEIIGLTDRRTMFTAQAGVPDGVKLDCDGRIYTGVGNGVAIYDKYGTHLGTVKAPDGCANLVLIPGKHGRSEIVALCERQIWKYTIKAKTCDIMNRKTF